MRDMRRARTLPGDRPLPCTCQPNPDCSSCELRSALMCRFDRNDLLRFLLGFLPFAATVVAGAIRSGLGVYLLAWLAYWPFFFFVWEGRALCSHCPYWAGEGRVLRCHANYGVIKIWAYRPGPMSVWDKAHFILGAALFVGFPLALLTFGGQYTVALVALATAVGGGYSLWRHGCSRCVNFSCPANHVPSELVDAYLRRNPTIRAAWEKSGYRLGE
jgi:hypothetical protein